MTAHTETHGYGVGYAVPAGVLRLGTIAPLHALDPVTGHGICGVRLSIRWDAEDAGQTTVDCVACTEAIARRASAR